MGRNKLHIHKLETNTSRKATFSKRRTGIIKKASDLSILCDADVLLLIFDTAGKPKLFLGKNSKFEEVIKRYGEVSAQERQKRRLEDLEALKKAFKKVDHQINMEELINQGSSPVEELNEQLIDYMDKINGLLNFLGPLAAIHSIDDIEDINVLDNMEKEIMKLATSIGAQKCAMNQLFSQNEASRYWYSRDGSQQIMVPQNPMSPQSNYYGNKDTPEFNNPYNTTINVEQDLWINSMDGIEQTIIDQPAGSISLTENVVLKKSNMIDDILQNNGGINGNKNENTNNNSKMKGLSEASSNQNYDFFNSIFEQDPFFWEDNVEQGVGSAMHHSNFPNRAFNPSDL